jgi:hypothetical protein
MVRSFASFHGIFVTRLCVACLLWICRYCLVYSAAPCFHVESFPFPPSRTLFFSIFFFVLSFSSFLGRTIESQAWPQRPSRRREEVHHKHQSCLSPLRYSSKWRHLSKCVRHGRRLPQFQHCLWKARPKDHQLLYLIQRGRATFQKDTYRFVACFIFDSVDCLCAFAALILGFLLVYRVSRSEVKKQPATAHTASAARSALAARSSQASCAHFLSVLSHFMLGFENFD